MRLNKTMSSLVVFVVLAFVANSFALTVEFNELTAGDRFNIGQTFYASAVPITVETFLTGGDAYVSNAQLADGDDLEIGLQNVTLEFGFNTLDGLSMQFGETFGAGDITVSVNGDAVAATDFTDLTGTVFNGGVRVFAVPTSFNTGALFFMGTITNFSIGGDDIYIDNIVASEIPEPATLALLGLGGLALIRKKRAA